MNRSPVAVTLSRGAGLGVSAACRSGTAQIGTLPSAANRLALCLGSLRVASLEPAGAAWRPGLRPVDRS